MDFWTNLLIGGTSGIISRTITAPLDLYKIQLQTPFMPSKSPLDVIRKEGIRHLWKGNLSNCIRVFPQQAINYPMYRLTQSMLPIEHTPTKTFLSGLLAGGTSTIITYPLETLRSRLGLQAYGTHYRGIFHAFQVTPFRVWYQGIGVCMTGFPVFNALTFTAYQAFSQYPLGTFTQPVPTMITTMFQGGIAGMLAVSITYPTDLLRRRMQLQGFDDAIPRYTSTLHAIQQIWRQQGIRGFYRGLGICYLKLFPASGIQFVCYQELQKLVNN